MNNILNEGGVGKHMQHLYDNIELTFGELKQILTMASEGRLEKTTEKLDGMNLAITWNNQVGDIRAARSDSDLLKGGMDAQSIAKKFADRGNVEEAFVNAFSILKKALSALSEDDKIHIFGENGSTWYTFEIIYTKNPNVIIYDRNNLIFHMVPVITVKNGKIERDVSGSNIGLDILTANIEQMQAAIDQKDWSINGPRLLQLKKLENGSILDKAISSIDAAMSNANVTDSDTIENYIRNLLIDNELSDLNISTEAKNTIVDYMLDLPNPGLNAIKKLIPKNVVPQVQALTKSKIVKEYIKPIELAVHWFAVEVLKGLHSTLINNSDAEVNRLKKEVAQAIDAIKSSNDENAMEILRIQMEKIQSLDNISAAMEGIVFIINDQPYKLCGNFSPSNQILGLFKYGRGSTKRMQPSPNVTQTSESILRKNITFKQKDDGAERLSKALNKLMSSYKI